MPSRIRNMFLTKAMTGRGSPGRPSGSGRSIPLGRPVVPDEYSMAAPSCSSSTGSGRIAGDRLLVALVAALGPVGVDHEPPLHSGAQRGQLQGHVPLGRRGHHHPGLAVVDDVGHLFGRQIGVDAGVVEAGPLGRPLEFEHAGIVLHEDGHVVEPSQSVGPEQLGQSVGSPLVLAECDDLTARGHDERWTVRISPGVLPRVHAEKLTRARDPACSGHSRPAAPSPEESSSSRRRHAPITSPGRSRPIAVRTQGRAVFPCLPISFSVVGVE